MKSSARKWVASLLFATAILATNQAGGQAYAFQFDRSKQESAEALKTWQAGDSRKAIEVAQAALRDCPAGAPGSPCRGLLNYTLGYIFQQQAQKGATPNDRNRAFEFAQASYKAALADDPGNATLHYNLALLLSNAGDVTGATSEMQQAVRADPKQWQYSLKLGDLQVRQKNWSGAMHAYEQAGQATPVADAPGQRVLELTRHGHGLSTNELQSRCKEWQATHPVLALSCYEEVMTLLYSGDNSAAEVALAAWVDLVARQDRIDDQALEELPQGWETPALSPLRAALKGDLSGAGNNWWTQSGRSEIWARFLLAVGQQHSSDAKTRERIWQTALTLVKDDPRSASSLELRGALALLYVRYPDLDPGQNKLNELVERIFYDKMGAIRSHDLEAEQRYHTVLGLIFAGQQKWGSVSDSHSAAFQLTWAVNVANDRYLNEGIYQPLPEIKDLLIRVYERSNQPALASQARWEAILAYMDSDQLDRAAQAIQAFQVAEGLDKATLNSVLKLRREAMAPAPERTASLITELAALGPRAGIKPDFLQRQQFKALADVVAASPASAEKTPAIQAAMTAFSLAVEQHVPLIGVHDLSRWQAVQEELVNTVGGKSERIQVRPGGPVGSAALKLALPGSTVPQNVEVSPQSIQAAEVAQVLGPAKLSQYGRAMTLSHGTLAGPVPAVATPEVRQKLETKGIKVVAVPQ